MYRRATSRHLDRRCTEKAEKLFTGVQVNPCLAGSQPIVRAINSLCVYRGVREVAAENWPADGRCYRGGGLPESERGFFQVTAGSHVIYAWFTPGSLFFGNFFQWGWYWSLPVGLVRIHTWFARGKLVASGRVLLVETT
jgi:hypothetical protein